MSKTIALTKVEAEYGISTRQLRHWHYNKPADDLPLAFKVGGRLHYDRADIEAYLAGQKESAAAARQMRRGGLSVTNIHDRRSAA